MASGRVAVACGRFADVPDRIDCRLRIEPTPGRRLRWAPDWACSDSAVLFDCNSGDYWVLSPLAGDVMRALELRGAMSVSALLHELRAQGSASMPTADELLPILSDLGRSGLVHAWDNLTQSKVAAEALHID